jgi:hypothetical protein
VLANRGRSEVQHSGYQVLFSVGLATVARISSEVAPVLMVTLVAVALASFVIGGTVCWVLLWALLRGTETARAKSKTPAPAPPEEEQIT